MNPLRIFLVAALFVAVFSIISDEVKAEDYPMYMKEANVGNGSSHLLSFEYWEDENREAVRENPPRSYESGPMDMTRTREWKAIGNWTSEELMYNMSFLESVKFNLWWRETDDGQDDDYDAQVQYRFRLLIDGEDAAFYSDEDNGEGYECAEDEPCEWSGITELNFTGVSEGAVFELQIEYWAFSDIEIYYDNFTMDSGVTLQCYSCYPVPVAIIDSPLYEAENGTLVEFNGSGTTDYGQISDYLWKSNIDGELSTMSQFNTTNLSLGNHIIYFSVTNTWGYNSTTSTSLWIYAVPLALANNFDWNDEAPKNKVKPGDKVIFKGGGNDEDGEIVLYEWDFNGDGEFDWSSEEAGSTTFVYKNEGTYTAVLQVTDNDGFTATDSRVITVSEDDDESSLPSVSMIPVLISIGLIARYRR